MYVIILISCVIVIIFGIRILQQEKRIEKLNNLLKNRDDENKGLLCIIHTNKLRLDSIRKALE